MASTREKMLQNHFVRGAPLRPVMTSLNGDNSWLLSFPRPEEERPSSSKLYYHIVFEPWLTGPANIGSSWLIHITTSETAAAQTVEAIDMLIDEVEGAGLRALGLDCRLPSREDASSKVDAVSTAPGIILRIIT